MNPVGLSQGRVLASAGIIRHISIPLLEERIFPFPHAGQGKSTMAATNHDGKQTHRYLNRTHRELTQVSMSGEAMQLPWIDFSGVEPSAPGTGTWSEVRSQVMDALASFGCFEARYPPLTPELRAALFDTAVRPLFALPVDVKRRNYYGADKPFHGYLGGLPGLDAYESLAIVDGSKPDPVRAFADLVWPDGGGDASFCETVHGAAKRITELEEAVRRMVMEGLGVAKYHEPLDESTWHLFRMSEYKAPNAAEKALGYLSHQDTNSLSVVCQRAVEGLEVQTRDGEWILVKPSPTSLVVIAGNALRAWTNDRLYAPFHRVTVSGDVTRYSAILFSVPSFKIQAPDELVDDQHPPRFKPHCNDDFVRFCVSEEGARHQDKLKAFCGV
ncbi:probable 2-oxoglutarate-dependent dioxygenase AOP1 [Phragmites australis]|uniref:probable 2-oxoglutarate-dependent dioxygenase AOP1 n=1 Tax=Phragmites australis TaxID=29695 RepID=UPI002D79D006|nr:probable 2-oxoglutarate-dependent dioxygenase AOP1 [Phragmites australis]